MGGDEQFFGYNRYVQGVAIGRFFDSVPHSARKYIGNMLGKVSVNSVNRIGENLPGSLNNPMLGDRLRKFSNLIKEQSFLTFYQKLTNRWKDPAEIVRVGQQVMVRVLEVDQPRKRISLSLREQ